MARGDRVVVTGTTIPSGQEELCLGPFTASNLTCADPVSFGDEEEVIASISGRTIALRSPLRNTHLGSAPTQGHVGLLTRNVILTSKNPLGRRGHTRVEGGTARISFAEFAHLGRREQPGIYPIHYHLIGNAGRNSYVEGASVRDSFNLGVSVHGTNFLRVAQTVVYNVIGHGLSTEDGTEVWNTFEGNLSVRTLYESSPIDPDIPINENPNDPGDRNEGSGFWINNGHNRVRANVAANTVGWGFDLHPPYGVSASLVDEAGKATPEVTIDSVEVLEFSDNEGYSTYIGGGFAIQGFRTVGENRIVNLHVWAERDGGPYPTDSTNVKFINLRAHDPGILSPYMHGQTAVVGSQIGTLYISPKRVWVWVLLEKGTKIEDAIFGPGCCHIGPLMVVINGNPGARKIELQGKFLESDPDGNTAMLEVYLLDYDGPGQHVKLIPVDTVPADGLAYTSSSRFIYSQEAMFTGSEVPALALPFRIDAGSDVDTVDGQGRRWRMDNPYLSPPPGFRFPGYGYQDDGGSYADRGDGTLAGSARYGTKFTYRVDLPNGQYRVALLFREGWHDLEGEIGGVGSRIFDVVAGGRPAITGLDVYKEVGQGRPLEKSFLVNVSQSQLPLDFVARTGNAMVSAIAICPASVSDCTTGR